MITPPGTTMTQGCIKLSNPSAGGRGVSPKRPWCRRPGRPGEASLPKRTELDVTLTMTRAILLLAVVLLASCNRNREVPAANPAEGPTTRRGAFEVTAQLVEIPEGAIFKRDLYNYATILKYKVIQVHRGQIQSDTIYVGHYNPWKPRSEASDRRVKDIGGNLRQFEAGRTHRMALEVPIDDYFMGGIVNKYFGQETGPIYWAVWTNLADR